jgi:hypothetical protein
MVEQSHADTIQGQTIRGQLPEFDSEIDVVRRAHEALDALVAENQRLRDALEFWYREVDKAQRLDNTGGDSAVAVTLNSWDEALHDNREALAGDTELAARVAQNRYLRRELRRTRAQRDRWRAQATRRGL